MIRKTHDRGGWPIAGFIDKDEQQTMDWEMHVDGLVGVLRQKGIIKTDELRRAIESIEPRKYESLKYYERWMEAVESLLMEKVILTNGELDQKVAELQKGKG